MATKKKAKKKVTKAKARPKRGSSPARSKKSSPRGKKAASLKSVAKKRTGLASKKPAKQKAPSKDAKKKKAQKKGRTPKPAGRAKTGAAIRRQDRPGHLDPHYAADLRARGGRPENEPRPFIAGPRVASDDFAEELGEGVVESATTGGYEAEETFGQVVPEEQGGPFVETNAAQEFAHGTDASNPKGAKREPFPTT